jgi:hypothetical protein
MHCERVLGTAYAQKGLRDGFLHHKVLLTRLDQLHSEIVYPKPLLTSATGGQYEGADTNPVAISWSLSFLLLEFVANHDITLTLSKACEEKACFLPKFEHLVKAFFRPFIRLEILELLLNLCCDG